MSLTASELLIEIVMPTTDKNSYLFPGMKASKSSPRFSLGSSLKFKLGSNLRALFFLLMVGCLW